MGICSRVEEEFLYGGHIFALGSACIAASTIIILKTELNLGILLLFYLIFYIIYLYDHFKGVESDALTNSKRTAYLSGRAGNRLIVFRIMFSLVFFILVLSGDTKVFILGALILVMGISYGIFFKNITKKIFAFKNFFVALVWSILIFYALLCVREPYVFLVGLFAWFVFVRMLSIQIFFDIRDIEGDKIKHLLTVPVVMGERKAVELIYSIDLFMTISLLAVYSIPFYRNEIEIFFLLILVYRFFYMKKYFEKDQSCFLWAAGEPIVWFIIVIISFSYELLLT